MSKYLVIVESPTKARTIHAILGSDYEVTSSMGHIVDLPKKRLSIDVEKGYIPKYRVISGKEKIIAQLKTKAKGKEAIYLATDPDREGEAISWHIQEKLSKYGKEFYRVAFHEITEDALKEAFASPGKVDENKVNAQVARRVLDRLVGYTLSPFLWKKIVRGLSAGRVQSVALKFIVERENEINAFIPKTTYTVEAKLQIGENTVDATLEKFNGAKAIFETTEAAQACIDAIKNDLFHVDQITKKTTKRFPPPPYTTSLLQQDGFSKLRFPSQKTMMVAQKLYEGITIKDETVGLITYMRTDSFHVSPKAKEEVKQFIQTHFSPDYLPEKEHRFKEKKGAQHAHEAIRPTSILRGPNDILQFVSPDEEKLYTMIWKRFLASFMKEATFENTKLLIASSQAEFIAEGRIVAFDGFLKILGKEGESEKQLPVCEKGVDVILKSLEIVEHITKPPARFNDASLVKLLEEKGIGRPSTYVPTIATILKRNYIRREKGAFIPTELGIKVNNLLVNSFPEIIDENFTAAMEEQLDEVEEGTLEWQKILRDFFPLFKSKIDEATLKIEKVKEFTDKVCQKCGGRLIVKWSRRGKFLSCEHYPTCEYAETITTDVMCPQCKEGKLIERRNKRGQNFYGCSKFPECRYTSRTLDPLAVPGESAKLLESDENKNPQSNENPE